MASFCTSQLSSNKLPTACTKFRYTSTCSQRASYSKQNMYLSKMATRLQWLSECKGLLSILMISSVSGTKQMMSNKLVKDCLRVTSTRNYSTSFSRCSTRSDACMSWVSRAIASLWDASTSAKPRLKLKWQTLHSVTQSTHTLPEDQSQAVHLTSRPSKRCLSKYWIQSPPTIKWVGKGSDRL